jgi:KDO2-lipid IV(A) lauroyltransferase
VSFRDVRRFWESAGFFLLTGLVRALPRRVGRAAGTWLGGFVFDVARIRRTVAVRNVTERLAPAGGLPEAERIARESYRVMARTFVDLVRLDRIDRSVTDRMFSPDDVEWFRSVERGGRGAVLVSGHFGNWEIMALAIRRLGLPLRVVAARQANAVVDEGVKRVRRQAGIDTISPGRDVREILRALRANEFVATLMDQDARRRGVFVDFLGVPASTHTGMLSLALRTGSPIVTGVMVDEGGSYRFVRGDVWRPRRDDPDNLLDGVAHFNSFLGEQVRRHPENYFWAHRRWKSSPPAAAPSGDQP